jgi:hypothetical protein
MRRKSSRPVLEAGERERFWSPSQHLLHSSAPDGSRATAIVRLDALHRRVLHLLGPADDNGHLALQQTAE